MSPRAFFTSLGRYKKFIKAITNYDSSKNVITPIKNANVSKEKT